MFKRHGSRHRDFDVGKKCRTDGANPDCIDGDDAGNIFDQGADGLRGTRGRGIQKRVDCPTGKPEACNSDKHCNTDGNERVSLRIPHRDSPEGRQNKGRIDQIRREM